MNFFKRKAIDLFLIWLIILLLVIGIIVLIVFCFLGKGWAIGIMIILLLVKFMMLEEKVEKQKDGEDGIY